MIPRGFKRFLSGEKEATDSRPPRFLAFRSNSIFILATVCVAIFTDILIYAIIVPVLPFALTSRAGIAEDSVQTWNAILLACYTIALFVGSPLVGLYADHTSSRRWPLLIGLISLTGSTILLCLGRSIALLVLGRLLQGFSAAIVWTTGLALIVDTVPRKIGEAMGYSAIAMSMGLLISPAIGGVVFAAAGYYAVYYIAFGCLFLDIILRLVLIEKKVARQWTDAEEACDPEQGVRHAAPADQPTTDEGDMPGRTLSEKRVDGAEKHAGTISDMPPTPSPAVEGSKPIKHPKLRLIKSRRLLGANFGIIVQSAVMVSWDTVLPLFVKSTFDWSSTAAGLMFLCVFIPGFASPIVGWLSDRYGARWPSFAGFVAAIPVLVCMRFVTEDTIGHKVLLGALLALSGLTFVFADTPLMAEITYAIEAEEAKNPGIFGESGAYGLGYGFFCMSFALGGTIGSLMSGYIMNGAGWATVSWSLAVLTAVGAVVVALTVGDTPPGAEKNPVECEENSAESRAQNQAVSGDAERAGGSAAAENGEVASQRRV